MCGLYYQLGLQHNQAAVGCHEEILSCEKVQTVVVWQNGGLVKY